MSRRFLMIGAVAVVVALMGASLASAQGGGVYYACVNDSSGTIKMVSAEAQCEKNWTKIDWNQVGPVGPEGQQGPQGEVGPMGPQGEVGPAGASATLAFNPVPTTSQTTLSSILVNGGTVTGPVAAGSSVQVSLSYVVTQPPECPYCIQQLTFGFAEDEVPSYCINIGSMGGSGSAAFALTAPAAAGPSYIRWDRRWEWDCAGALGGWSYPALPSHVIGVAAVVE